MKPWETLAAAERLDARPWLTVIEEHVRLPNGHELPDYYRVTMPDWVQVFAVLDDGRVAMIEQYKHGPHAVSLELPAGYIDPGESPEAAIRRELLEETGYEALDWRALGHFFVDGNRGCGETHVFLAQGARRARDPQLEDSEIIAVRLLTLDAVRAAWLGGRIRNMGTMCAVGLALGVLEQGP